MIGTTPVRRVAGVLGGMGPEATVDFLQRVIALTPAACDQDHVRMLVEHNPTVPSRQNAGPANDRRIRAELVAMAERLQVAGADFLVMVCNTAHGFADEARRAVDIPFVSIIDVTVEALRHRCPDAQAAGILATPACIDAGLYQAALAATGIASIGPGAVEQAELMQLIDRVKAGDKQPGVRDGMRRMAMQLVQAGAGAVIAGCTEIPLVLDAATVPVPVISSTEELARTTVALALGERALQSVAAPGPINQLHPKE